MKFESRNVMFLIFGIVLLGAATASAEQYEVLPQRGSTRGQLWVSDGPGLVQGENNSAANRFRLGIELQFGEDYRFDLGWTIFDWISSKETSAAAGDISRSATDFNVGYYFIPDDLWLTYSLHMENVKGSDIGGVVSAYGHQLALGYRFYSRQNVGLSAELAYLYVPPVSAHTYDFTTNTPGSVIYPTAQIWTLNLRLGLDLGG